MLPLLLSASLTLPPVLSIDQVKPGQKGQCLTVFEGSKVEPFPFVVKGVMKNFLGPKKDVILVRLEGDKAEFTGVVAGMSGSPCSIDGKLMGALAYSFTMFAKEPIAGITPMNSMLDIMALPDEPRPWRIGADQKEADWQAFRAGRAPEMAMRAVNDTGLQPIATPLTIAGMLPAVREYFSPWLESRGFLPMAGGSGASGAKAEPIKPGSAVAAVLVRGDVDIAATGTVTSVDGNEVLAFGHPFFGAGAVSLPMANAQIVNTMVSSMRSFKMAVTGAVIGEVTQDRLTAIGGFLGREPAMLKVHGQVTTPKTKSGFNFEVARDHTLSPRFVAMGIANSLTGRTDVGERGTVRLDATIRVRGEKPVVIKNVYAAERDTGLLVYPAVDVAQRFATLWETPFGPPPMLDVQVSAKVDPEPVQESIEAIHLDRARARPGENIEVAVELRKKGGGLSMERFVVPVPYGWAGEDVEITAAGGSEAQKMSSSIAGELRPNKLGDIIHWLGEQRSDGDLYLIATRRGVGMRAGVEMMPFVPPSVVATLSGGSSVALRSRGIAWEAERERPGVVSGMAPATLHVLDR